MRSHDAPPGWLVAISDKVQDLAGDKAVVRLTDNGFAIDRIPLHLCQSCGGPKGLHFC